MLPGASALGAACGDGKGRRMEREARRNARLHLVTGMAQGQPWQEAATVAGLRTSRTAAYRLLRVVRT